MTQERDGSNFFDNNTFVEELMSQDFQNVASWRLVRKECTVVLFYCAWCPHCQDVKKTWKEFGRLASFMTVAAFNCEREKAHLQKIREDMPGLIPSFPTIVFYKGGRPSESYLGKRDLQSFLKAAMRVCQEDEHIRE